MTQHWGPPRGGPEPLGRRGPRRLHPSCAPSSAADRAARPLERPALGALAALQGLPEGTELKPPVRGPVPKQTAGGREAAAAHSGDLLRASLRPAPGSVAQDPRAVGARRDVPPGSAARGAAESAEALHGPSPKLARALTARSGDRKGRGQRAAAGGTTARGRKATAREPPGGRTPAAEASYPAGGERAGPVLPGAGGSADPGGRPGPRPAVCGIPARPGNVPRSRVRGAGRWAARPAPAARGAPPRPTLTRPPSGAARRQDPSPHAGGASADHSRGRPARPDPPASADPHTRAAHG